jgi:hypothetical protein
LRGDHAAAGDHRRFADLLGVAELVAHVVAFVVLQICRKRAPPAIVGDDVSVTR